MQYLYCLSFYLLCRVTISIKWISKTTTKEEFTYGLLQQHWIKETPILN